MKYSKKGNNNKKHVHIKQNKKKNAKKSRHKINDMLAKVKELKTQEINIKKRKPIKWDKHLIAVHQRPNEKRLN